MKLLSCLIIYLAALTGVFGDTPIEDFAVVLEGDEDIEVTVLFEGPAKKPVDLVRVTPGPWSIDLTDLPPDEYDLILHAEGYAEERIRLTYTPNGFIVKDSKDQSELNIKLYRKRYQVVEVYYAQTQDLLSPKTKHATLCVTYLGKIPGIPWDYAVEQFPPFRYSDNDSVHMAVRNIRRREFFGVCRPKENENFEESWVAPSNDHYVKEYRTYTPPGSWFWFRAQGNNPSELTYAKVRFGPLLTQPPENMEVAREFLTSWEKAVKTAERYNIQLPE